MWNQDKYNSFILELKQKSDSNYRDFSLRIIKTNYEMLGVRTPFLDKMAKSIDSNDIDEFYKLVQFKYYEEVMILGFVIARIKDYKIRIKYFDNFVKRIDNWAICDMVICRFKLKEDALEYYLDYIKKLSSSNDVFTVRAAYVFLLNYYVSTKYLNIIFSLISANKCREYYVSMAIAWLLSYCYFIDKDRTIEFITSGNISTFIHNKAINKIRESLRIDREERAVLKLLLKKE